MLSWEWQWLRGNFTVQLCLFPRFAWELHIRSRYFNNRKNLIYGNCCFVNKKEQTCIYLIAALPLVTCKFLRRYLPFFSTAGWASDTWNPTPTLPTHAAESRLPNSRGSYRASRLGQDSVLCPTFYGRVSLFSSQYFFFNLFRIAPVLSTRPASLGKENVIKGATNS